MDRVLLLNRNKKPLCTISAQDAANLLITDKAYGAKNYETGEIPIARTFRTPRVVFEVPSVLVLKRFINVPHRNKKWSRRGVLERDNYTCIFCGKGVGDIGTKANGLEGPLQYRDLSIEHINPVSRGGESTWGNTACACYDCNHRKANRRLEEAGMKLRWEPKTPRTNYWVASGNVPVSWKIWLES